MPVYCFKCNECDTVFDVNASFKDKDNGLEPECPKCHGKKARQFITAEMFVQSNEGVRFSGPACDPDKNPGCCG